MAPKKTKATTSTNDAIPNMPPPQTQPVETHIPPQSPAKTAAIMTAAQKQALMDNLQLEVTERARKLRADYARQAQVLRSRLEMRVNRIPQALRKRKMQDLMDEHIERSKPAPAVVIPVHEDEENSDAPVESSTRKSLKRQSEQISTDNNKENSVPLPNPKKRAKPAATTAPPTSSSTSTTAANTKAARTTTNTTTATARKPTVLSPKSHNPRAIPRPSPEKPQPIPTKRVPSRAANTKRNAHANDPASESSTGRSSGASDSSAGTTVVTTKKAAAASSQSKGGKAAAGARKVVGAVAKAASKRGVGAGKKETVATASSAAGGRSLRKRA